MGHYGRRRPIGRRNLVPVTTKRAGRQHFCMPKRADPGFKALLVLRHYVLRFPETLLSWVLTRVSPAASVDGMRIVDASPQPHNEFARICAEAVALMKEKDPVRARRLRREISIVMHTPASFAVGKYSRPLRFCEINLKLFSSSDPKAAVALFASALVYGATYGHLLSWGILQTRRNFSRVERLCCLEAERFLLKLGVAHSLWSLAGDQAITPLLLHERLLLTGHDLHDLVKKGK